MDPKIRQIQLTLRDQQFLKRLLEVVKTRYDNEQFGVEELSREMALSRSQLHRKLEELTGLSAGQMIR